MTNPKRVLFFWKTQRQARKAILGAVYNFTSRVAGGVVAGVIITQLSPALTNNQQITPSQGAAAVGSVIN